MVPKRHFPLASIIITSLISITVAFYFLSHNYFIIFQNLFYIPIILACYYYRKSGFMYAIAMTFLYFTMIVTFTGDNSTIQGAAVRVAIFIAVAWITSAVSIARYETENELRETQRQLEFVLEAANVGLDIIDKDLTLRYVDPRWATIYGDWSGRKCYEYFMDRNEQCPGCGIPEALRTKQITTTEEVLAKENNRPIEVTTIPFKNDKGEWLVAEINTDITERKKAEERLRWLAYHDNLTALPNRTLFNDRLTMALAQNRREKKPLAVMMLDLDNFKQVNDTLGHTVGDLLLKATARRITLLLRESDTLARMGGDEFLLLFPSVSRSDGAESVAQKLVDSFAEPFECGTERLEITASIGIAMYPESGPDGSSLIRNADIAMYCAKSRGRNQYSLHKKT